MHHIGGAESMVSQEKPLQESGVSVIMLLAEDTKSFVEDIFSSYETRMQGVEVLFETTNQILQGFQDSVLDIRQEREKISGQLKENLARNGSLRRKDFDNMMSVVSSYQDRQEQESLVLVWRKFIGYLRSIDVFAF